MLSRTKEESLPEKVERLRTKRDFATPVTQTIADELAKLKHLPTVGKKLQCYCTKWDCRRAATHEANPGSPLVYCERHAPIGYQEIGKNICEGELNAPG
jgi:hypothetical protein